MIIPMPIYGERYLCLSVDKTDKNTWIASGVYLWDDESDEPMVAENSIFPFLADHVIDIKEYGHAEGKTINESIMAFLDQFQDYVSKTKPSFYKEWVNNNKSFRI